MASTSLSRTNTTTSSNRKTGTFSAWVKRSSIASGNGGIITAYIDSNNYTVIYFDGSSQLCYLEQQSGSTESFVSTTRLFRDTSAWYHIVVSIDATQSTASNRVKFYVNGVQETALNSTNYPSDTTLNIFGNSSPLKVGEDTTGSPHYFNGSMAHVHFIDGTAYDADTFGETDSTTGIWKPKTAPSVTYGTNGFFLKFENSAAFGTDSSGNSNTFTVNGTMTQNIDTPSNVFATLNPLQTGSASVSNAPLTNGNNTFTSSEGAGVYPYYFSTLGMSSGKYYVEFKFVNSVSGAAGIGNGVADSYSGNNAYDYSYYYDGRLYNSGSGESTGYGAISNNDILGCALDLDNNKVYFHINGTYQASGDPVAGTGGKSITAPASNGTGFYQFEVGDSGSTSPTTIQCNFGNGYFGTTAVSSAQNPDDGIGIFEYDVPTGYYALNTKAINAQEYD